MRCNRWGKVLLGTILPPMALALVLASAAWPEMEAQRISTPALHQRSADQDAVPEGQPQQETADQEPSTLPGDVSGAYHFDRSNEFVEIDIERNRLTGYISRLGDAETDRNTPLTFFFDKASVNGSQIQFQTRVVHGVWYSFRGTIVRGEGKTRDDDGYYVLHGALQVHHPASREDKSADETIEKRMVNFKSMGQ